MDKIMENIDIDIKQALEEQLTQIEKDAKIFNMLWSSYEKKFNTTLKLREDRTDILHTLSSIKSRLQTLENESREIRMKISIIEYFETKQTYTSEDNNEQILGGR